MISDSPNDTAVIGDSFPSAEDTARARFYFNLDYEDLANWERVKLFFFQERTAYEQTGIYIRQDGSGNLELAAQTPGSGYFYAGSDGYIQLDTWYELEFKAYRHATSGTLDVWLNGELIISQTGVDTGDYDYERSWLGLTYHNGANQIFYDNVAIWDDSMEYDWEYWDGNSWEELAITGTHGMRTEAFLDDGTFWWDDPPTNWRPYSVNGSTDLYYIRGSLAGGSYSTSPVENRLRTDILLLQYYDDLTESDQTLITPSTVDSPTPVIAYWKFDEGYGTTAHDSMGYNDGESNATFAPGGAAPTWVEESRCLSGKCLEFDGIDDHLTATSSSILNSVEGYEVSFSAWIRHGPQTSGTDTILAKYETTGTDGGYKLLMESDGDLTFGIDNNNGSFPRDKATSSEATYDDNTWHHVVGVKDASSIKLYIDGLLVNTDNNISTDGSIENDDTFYIGIDGDGTSNPFDGFIDEVKVYRYALSEAQVKTDYQGGKRGLAAKMGGGQDDWLSDGLVGYWKMDEGSGNISDTSGNDVTGTNTGAAWTGGKFGNGLDFDTNTDYVSLSTNNMSPTTGTVSFWYKPTGAYDTDAMWGLFGRGNGGTANDFVLLKAPTGSAYILSFSINAGVEHNVALTTDEYSSYWTAGEWMYLTCTYSDQQLAIYIDGNLIKTSTVSGWTSWTPPSTWYIGNYQTNSSANGVIDDFRVYNRALSPAEVQKLYEWAPGPVAHWKMDEGSWTNDCSTDSVFDTSGNGSHGDACPASTGPTGGEVGKYGKAGKFDDTDDYIEIGDQDILDFDYGDFTVEAWVNLTANGQIAGKWDYSATVSGYGLYATGGNLTFQLGNDSNGTCDVMWYGNQLSYPYTPGVWTHHAVTIDRDGYAKMYVDGVMVDSYDISASSACDFSNSYNFRIGKRGTSSNFIGGKIDEVRVYDYARTPGQIVEDMNAGHPTPGSPVGSAVGHWKFDEGYGDTAYDTGTGGNNGDLAGSGTTCPQSADSACPSWSNDGKSGKTLDFDTAGTDDYVELVGEGSDFSIDDFTVSAWVYRDADSGAVESIISNLDSASDGWALQIDSTDVARLSYNGQNVLSTSTISTGGWYHVVATSNSTSSETKIYINGKIENTLATSGSISENTDARIGTRSYNPVASSFSGKIDDLRFYNNVLTADQVKLLYNQGFANVWGATSTDSSGNASWSATDEYCPPGQGSTCVGPVAEWNFDENNGQYTYDTSENNNTGTLIRNAAFRPGKFGSAVHLDGVAGAGDDTHIQFPNDAFNSLAQGSISMWFKPDDSGDSTQILFSMFDDESDDDWWELYYDRTNDRIYVWSDFDSCSGLFVGYISMSGTQTNWHHLVYTNDSSGNKFYLDGIQRTATYTSGSASTDCFFDDHTAANTEYYALGCYNTTATQCGDGEMYEGLIDEFRIYDYARTPAQVAWSYNRGAPIGWWKFDEGSGDTANNSGSVGSTNNGDLAGSGTTCPTAGACPTWTSNGKLSNALEFDGQAASGDDYVDAGTDSSVDNIFSGGGTVSVWFKIDGYGESGFGRILDKNSTDTAIYVSAGGVNDETNAISLMREGTSTGRWHTQANTITTGTWYHFVAVFNEDSLSNDPTFYLNGKEVLVTETTSPSGSYDNDGSGSLIIGNNSSGSRTFDGIIDELKIFNYELTPQQVKSEYNQGALRFSP
ncbi:LamG domain-containing protein [Patescibacteria group bacterium]